jgi:hypothetical protein
VGAKGGKLRPKANPATPTELVRFLVERLDFNNLVKSDGVDKNKLLYEYGKGQLKNF